MALALFNKSILEEKFEKLKAEENLSNYMDIRSRFKTGDLIFFSGDHWLSSLIRWRSKSAWSHIGMVIRLEEIDRVFLVESILETGVRLVPMSFVFTNYGGNNKPYNGRVAWARHTLMEKHPAKTRLIKEFCMDNLTLQYDRKEYWRILWRTLIGSKEIFHDDKYTCSEYVWSAYEHADIELPKEHGYFISPGAFWRQEGVHLMQILI